MPTGVTGSRVNWDDTMEKHLLFMILYHTKPQIDWAQVAATFGQGVTPGALSQKYQKIRKRDAENFNLEDDTPVTTPKSGAKRGRGKKGVDEDVMDDEEMAESPTKKAKKNGKGDKLPKKVKEEPDAGDYADSEATTIKKDMNGDEDDDVEGAGDAEEA